MSKYFRTNRVSVCPAGIQRQLLCSPTRFPTFFYVLLTVHISIILAIDQLNAQIIVL